MKTLLILIFTLFTTYCYSQIYKYNTVHIEVDAEKQQEEPTDIIFNFDIENSTVRVNKIVENDTMNSVFSIVDSDISKRFGLFMAVDFVFCIDYKKDVIMVTDRKKKLFFYNSKTKTNGKT